VHGVPDPAATAVTRFWSSGPDRPRRYFPAACALASALAA
jgi:hypothetical protein